MKKVYEVAGHRFAVLMPDGDRAWGEMQKYEPFLAHESEPYAFAVEMIEEMPDTSDKRFVLSDNQASDMPRNTLYEWAGNWLVESAPSAAAPVLLHIVMDKDFKTARFHVLGAMDYSVNAVIMLMFALTSARSGMLLMHASVILHAGKGYLFLGKSGTGKSTHSQLWMKNIAGCELLNDDNPVLKVEGDGTIHVYGSPWSGKTPCYRNSHAPVGAIVDLHQAAENEIRRLSLFESYAAVYVSFSGFRFVKEIADALHDTNEKIVRSVPCYSLHCLPNAEAAWLCHNTVAN